MYKRGTEVIEQKKKKLDMYQKREVQTKTAQLLVCIVVSPEDEDATEGHRNKRNTTATILKHAILFWIAQQQDQFLFVNYTNMTRFGLIYKIIQYF